MKFQATIKLNGKDFRLIATDAAAAIYVCDETKEKAYIKIMQGCKCEKP